MKGVSENVLYSVPDAARALGLHDETVRRWIREGRLQAERVPGRGRGSYRVRAQEIDRVRSGGPERPLEQRALGKYLFRTGDLNGAERCYEVALRASRGFSDRLGEAKSLYKLGQLAQCQSRFDEAEDRLLAASVIFAGVSCRKGEDATRLALADLALARPRSRARRDVLLLARQRYGEALLAGDDRDRAVAERGLGEIALAEGDLDEARRRLDSALRLAASLDDRLIEADAMRSMARLFLASGEPHEARWRLELAGATYKQFGLTTRDSEVEAELKRARSELSREGLIRKSGDRRVRNTKPRVQR